MAVIRPAIDLTNGRVQMPLRVNILDVLVGNPITSFLTANTASASGSIVVKNISGFAINQILLIGQPALQSSEIIKTNSSTPPSGSTVTLASNTVQAHSASTFVYIIPFDQIEFAISTTEGGTKTSLALSSILADQQFTEYNDVLNTAGYYYARYVNSIGATFTISGPTFTSSAHGLSNGQTLKLTAVTTMPTGLNTATIYYVVGATTNTFGVALTPGGVAITPSDSGSGTLSWFRSSTYSSSVLYEGYGILAARAVIDAALQEINKQKSETLSDVFFYTQLDNCQTEVIQDLKRWSFMQLFDQTVGNTTTGSWKFTLPTNIGVDNSNKSVYQLRVATQQRLNWVDKEKFDEFLVGVAYTTLAAPALNNDSTLTLVDSSSFNSLASQTSDGSGSVTIGANTYAYSANDTTTGILTLSSNVTTGTTAPLGADVFQGATQGLPTYWTTYGGVAFYWPIASQSYNGFQLLMDYYIKQTRITNDNDNLTIPDPTVAMYYLCWKSLKKLNNGEESESSLAYNAQYLARKEKMRVKEVMNRTFKFRPLVQNFAVQSEFNESTPRWVRDANFPNTGF